MLQVTATTTLMPNNNSLDMANLLMDTLLHTPIITLILVLLLAKGRLEVATPTGERTH